MGTKVKVDLEDKMRADVLDFLEDALILNNTHTEQLLCTPILIQHVVGVFAKLFHVGANEHLAELDKVAMIFVVDLNDTPGVGASTDLAAIRCLDKLVGADNSEWNLACDLLRLR